MLRTPRVPVVAGLMAAATCVSAQDFPVEGRSAYHDYRIVTVADGLVNPWSIAFLPDGDILVTEKPGRLRIIRDGQLLPEPVEGVPAVLARGQGGLLDVVLHPEYASNNTLYLSFSRPHPDREGAATAIVRARFERDALHDVEEIFVANHLDEFSGRGHYGSRIAFDADGYLFFTSGERQAPSRGVLEEHPAQDPSNHHGTVNRIHDDGRIPSDNPFIGRPGVEPSIYSFGHRNPQGLAIHPETGAIWSNEHGPQGGDELNLIQPGLNYGWPVVGYGVNYGSGSAIHASTTQEGMENPVHFWVPSIATSGLMIYTGDQFPEWRGNIFVGGMAGEQLARLTLDGNIVVAEETLAEGIGRIRDVRQGPDGFIYLAIDDRSGDRSPIVRMEPIN